jgi:hypothetical protein
MKSGLALLAGCIGIACLLTAGSANSEPLERTASAERLFNASLALPQERQAFAQAIFDYCSATAKYLPANPKREDEEMAKALSTNALHYTSAPKHFEKFFKTVRDARYTFQKALAECRQLSGNIIARAYKSHADEAVLWVQLENVFDQPALTAIYLGILRVDKNHNTVTDLHGIQYWPMVRGAIRSGVLLHLLQRAS